MLGLGDLQLDEKGRLRLKRGVYLAYSRYLAPCLSMPKFLPVMFFVIRSRGSCLPSRTTEALKLSRLRKEGLRYNMSAKLVKYRNAFELTRNVEGGPR